MEVLNSLFIEADWRQALAPLNGQAIQHRVSLYADDLVLLVAPSATDLECVLQILNLFAGASGLITNVNKCVATLIRCTDEMMAIVQQTFPCVVTPFPCKYLGVPLSLRRLKRSHEQHLIDSVAPTIPTWKVGLLTNAGRVLFTKVTLMEGRIAYQCGPCTFHQSDFINDTCTHEHSLLPVQMCVGSN
jgi:hypothetical protein